MSEAIFGLIGVVLGGCITVLESRLDAARAEKRENAAAQSQAKVARRLLASDLQVAERVLAYPVDASWFSMVTELLPTGSWVEHRLVMAQTLSDEEWRCVARAMSVIEATKVGVEQIRTLEKDPAYHVEDSHENLQRGVNDALEDVREARRVLD